MIISVDEYILSDLAFIKTHYPMMVMLLTCGLITLRHEPKVKLFIYHVDVKATLISSNSLQYYKNQTISMDLKYKTKNIQQNSTQYYQWSFKQYSYLKISSNQLLTGNSNKFNRQQNWVLIGYLLASDLQFTVVDAYNSTPKLKSKTLVLMSLVLIQIGESKETLFDLVLD